MLVLTDARGKAMKNDFTKQTANQNQTGAKNDRDGMMGGLLFDCLLGLPLSDCFTEAAEMLPESGDPILAGGMVIDMYDEYRADRMKNDRTNGTIEMGVAGSVYGTFNRLGAGSFVTAAQPAAKSFDIADIKEATARMKRAPGLHMAA